MLYQAVSVCFSPIIACTKEAAEAIELAFICCPLAAVSATAAAASAASGLLFRSALSGTEAELAVAGVSSPLDFGCCRASSSLEQQSFGISGLNASEG